MLLGNLIGLLLIVIISITYFLPGNFTFIFNFLVILIFLGFYFMMPEFLSETAEGGLFVYLASVISLAIPYYQIQNFPLKEHTVSQNELTSTLMGSLAIISVLYILELKAFSHSGNNGNQSGGLGINKIFFIGAIYNWINYTRIYVLNSFFTNDGLKSETSKTSAITNYIKNEENNKYVNKSQVDKT